jgi:glycosyltransferase involved in cell wall biosynthesis
MTTSFFNMLFFYGHISIQEMKKILYIVNVDWFFVSHRLPIALAAIANGFEVHIACAITDKKEMLEELGVHVHPLLLSRSGINVFSEFKALMGMYEIIHFVKPSIVHTITIKPVLYGNILARILKIPVRISSISGLGFVFIDQRIKTRVFRIFVSLLYRFSLHNSKAIIFQNNEDKEIIKGLGAINANQDVMIRGSGVDLNKYVCFPEPDGIPVVMFVARLLHDKGVCEFAEAARIIQKKNIIIRMVLVGDIDLGNPNSVSTKQVDTWVNLSLLEHWGHSNNIPETMAKANLIVLPSYREGLPKSLIEAAACGRAVITTDVPGCRDAIESGKTGLLVEVKSSESLAKAIIDLVEDKDLRTIFSVNGRALAEESFSIDDVISKHLSIYQQY